MLKDINTFVSNHKAIMKMGVENRDIILNFCDSIIQYAIENESARGLEEINLCDVNLFDTHDLGVIATKKHLLWIPNSENILRAGRFDDHDHRRWTFTLWFVDANTSKIVGKNGENFGYHKFSINKETNEISYLHSTSEI